MGTYTVTELNDIQEIHDKWVGYEHDHWHLVSFGWGRARFGYLDAENLVYTKYVNITQPQIDFIKGVPNCVFKT